jgi:hypothetical protein
MTTRCRPGWCSGWTRRSGVLEALEDSRLELREAGAAPGLQDELATVIRTLHSRLGFDEGGVP